MTDTVVAAYEEHGSIIKTAKHLGISKYLVDKILREAGYKIQKKPAETLCFSCQRARADKCLFMLAANKKAEITLQAMGSKYAKRTYSHFVRHTIPRGHKILTVLECPQYVPDGQKRTERARMAQG